MRIPAVAIAVAAAAAPALAQDARIQSGEHATFSRLVIYLPEASDYQVEAGERSFAIDFEADFGFDTSDVFYYIPRTRVAELAVSPGRIGLDLACDCQVSVERLSDTIVFLDVRESDSVEQDVVAGSSPAPARPQTARRDRPRPAAIRLPLTELGATATLLPSGLSLPVEPRAAEAQPAPDDRAYETSRAVAEQVARATAQGVLEAEDVVPPLPSSEAAELPPVEAPAQPKDQAEAPVKPRPTQHLSIRSSVDEALGRDVKTALSDIGLTGPCIDDGAFDAASWSPEGIGGIARLRPKVIGEFDRPDPEGVANLARAYIALTFGAEARHTIETFRAGVPDADILLAMADIVDHGQAREPGRLASQYDCDGAGALWAAMSQPRIPDAAELDAHAVTLAFSALPPQLRKRLGPTLAERLLDHGAAEAASVVRTAILRAPGDPTVETELLDAAIALDAGRDEEADGKLAEVVEETGGRSVEAVERLIERRLDTDQPVEDEVLAAADALIYEHRGTPLAYRLSELRIEGLARSGESRRALAFLAETARHLPAETVDRLRGVSYAEAASQLDDADFLLVAVKASEELGRTPEEMAARRAVARRLAEMELFDLAGSLGVAEGVVGDAAPAPAAAVAAPALREAMPDMERTLERTAALLEHSAALRTRLSSTLGEGEAIE